MNLAEHVNTLGQHLLRRYGEPVHKVAIDAGFDCPNRDGSKGRGGCTFCNNESFVPAQADRPSIAQQIDTGRVAVFRVTGARKLIAYFQAYTNTYDDVEHLRQLYAQALAQPDVIGLSVGTRPDCVPDAVLDLLRGYQEQGFLVWLELGLQSSFDHTLAIINRGHDFACYVDAVRRARLRGLNICTHLILGLPGETPAHAHHTLQRVLDLGCEGLKLHPLHVVKSTMLAYQWKRGLYQPMTRDEYVELAISLVRQTPPAVIYHRLTGTANRQLLLAPAWCEHKWAVLNAIAGRMASRGWWQGDIARS